MVGGKTERRGEMKGIFIRVVMRCSLVEAHRRFGRSLIPSALGPISESGKQPGKQNRTPVNSNCTTWHYSQKIVHFNIIDVRTSNQKVKDSRLIGEYQHKDVVISCCRQIRQFKSRK
jgi:hypothetical protein